MKFLITIDTEADNQWDHGIDLNTKNIEHVPRFQVLCNRYNIKPTYLVTTEVCENEFAKNIFSQYSIAGQAEIGAHLHSWTTPPFVDKEGYRYNDPFHAFATEMPDNLLIEKLKNLTSQIESSFGTRPVSFRSGRYGFDERVAKVLIELGYKVDSSVTPFTNWKNCKGAPSGVGGPDFMHKTNTPYTITTNSGSILEVPVTILPTKWPLTHNPELARYLFQKVDDSFFMRAVRKLMFANQPLWLRPNKNSKIENFIRIINEAKRLKLPFIVMMFHSSELMPGGSPYWTNEKEIEILYRFLEEFFSFLQDNNIESITLNKTVI